MGSRRFVAGGENAA